MSGVDLIIFGATGDLSARKLFPALFQLDAAGLLPDDLRIIAVARQEQTTEGFHEELLTKMGSAKRQSISDTAWQQFVQPWQMPSKFEIPQSCQHLWARRVPAN